jgi:hypothetical protein
MIPTKAQIEEMCAMYSRKNPTVLHTIQFRFVDEKPKSYLEPFFNPTAKGTLFVDIEPNDNLGLADFEFCAYMGVWIDYWNAYDRIRAKILYKRLKDLVPTPAFINFWGMDGIRGENFATGKTTFFPLSLGSKSNG